MLNVIFFYSSAWHIFHILAAITYLVNEFTGMIPYQLKNQFILYFFCFILKFFDIWHTQIKTSPRSIKGLYDIQQNPSTKNFENSFSLSLNTYLTIHHLTFSFESGKKMSQKKFDGIFPNNKYDGLKSEKFAQWCRYFPERFRDCIFHHVVLGETLRSWLFLVVYIFGLFLLNI